MGFLISFIIVVSLSTTVEYKTTKKIEECFKSGGVSVNGKCFDKDGKPRERKIEKYSMYK